MLLPHVTFSYFGPRYIFFYKESRVLARHSTYVEVKLNFFYLTSAMVLINYLNIEFYSNVHANLIGLKHLNHRFNHTIFFTMGKHILFTWDFSSYHL